VQAGVIEEVAPGLHDLQVIPPGRPDAPVTELEDARAGHRGDDGGMGRHDGLRPRVGQVVQQRHEAQARDERQRRVRLVHQVEAALVHPGPQDLKESLAVAQLVEPLAGPARVLLQVGVKRVHGVSAQEVGPRRAPADPALNRQVPPGTGLGLPHADGRGEDGPALRVEPVRLGQYLDDRRLPRPVLADQDRDPRRELKPLAEQLSRGGHGSWPGILIKAVGTSRRQERSDQPRVTGPVA
jgi:hypothetical protein